MAWQSIVTKLVGGSVGDMAEGVANAIDKFVETEEEKKAAELLLIKMQQNPDKWQLEVNKIEATHKSLFIAGWRPAVGWICVGALSWGWLIAPVLQFFYPDQKMPGIEVGEAISLIMAMLGMGSLRTYEKRNGLTK